jgi:hypothetical protein
LVFGDFPRPFNGIGFAVKELGSTLSTGTLDRPSVLTGNYMLIPFCHVDHLCHSEITAHLYVRQEFKTRTKC